MSYIEELLYSAEAHGKGYQMAKELEKIKKENPRLSLEEQYHRAYQNIMKT